MTTDHLTLCASARADLDARRKRLNGELCGHPALIVAGTPRVRNFPAATYPFRASSHFIYLIGASLPGALLLIHDGRTRLFIDIPGADDALWHGVSPTRDELAATFGCEIDDKRNIEAVIETLTAAGRPPLLMPALDRTSSEATEELLGLRPAGERDSTLREAILTARLTHDSLGLSEITSAIEATERAFRAGMSATRAGTKEWTVRGAMEGAVISSGMTCAFEPIVSTQGEVLHNRYSHRTMQAGDLLLVDFGAESRGGWASDVTRTWPVSGHWSPTQRDLYDVVLSAQLDAIQTIAPGVRYRDVHMTAAKTLTQGLVDLGIFEGDVDLLVEDGLHALFFPHGVGHLMGLDVHDMEDLGDLAGYPKGRARDCQFGLNYLRLDRTLTPGMVVTVEPGFYQVPALLDKPELQGIKPLRGRLNRARLAQFSDVRGIRIEDDILVTDSGRDVLSAAIPKTTDALELVIGDK